MNDGSCGYSHRNLEPRQVNGSHSMQAPATASSAAIHPLWQSDFRNMHPSRPTSFQEDIQRSSGVENGDSSFSHSQSTDNSRLRNSHSPSVQGSSQTSLTTVEGISEPLSVGNAANKPPKPFDTSVRTATRSAIPENSSVTLEDHMDGRFATSGPKSPSKFSIGGNDNSSMASTAYTDAASSSHSQYPSNVTSKPRVGAISGHKRTATGDIKAISEVVEPRNSDLNSAWRRRSKSIGTPSHGSRIAEVS